ncbi:MULTISPECIES: DUF1289 domain-containing protein [Sphingobium]|uniref:DUF1289 domain-containing protein n=1 Tax=Sphingobium TaxID=165695 RepID=UPI000E71A42A|nr:MULTISPECIES: DUF1289 domain-containing protein [Sphingobium]KAA9019051.1 DUF1289 domain-containing protein [Sphingobium limneticum]MBU0932785.1 DUF1289 domain-containing protein [Alphaproteobacteria bacterium]
MESPCRNLCSLDQNRRACAGCGRTIEEIVHWRSLGDTQRAAVMKRVRDFQPLRRPSSPPPARHSPPSS